MKKLLFISSALLVLIVVGFFQLAPAILEQQHNQVVVHEPWPVSEAAQTLHDSLLVGDWHSDSLLWDRDLLQRSDYGHVDFPRLVEGNVAFQGLTAVTKSPSGQNYQSNSEDAADNITSLVMAQSWPVATWSSIFERALYQVQRLQDLEQRAPQQVRIIRSPQDIDQVLTLRAQGTKIVGALMGMEGAHPLEGKLENLNKLYDAGYRMIGLQHFFDNKLGGSLHGESNAGLTEFGKQVVQLALDKNMVIDVAHSSPAVVLDVLSLTQRPLLLSHSGIYSHCQHKRNIPNALMKRIANNGGVVGIGFWNEAVCDDTPQGIVKAIRAAITAIGVDHVSLGSDYDGSVQTQFDSSELAALTHQMLQQGFNETEIRKVMGENMLRVMRASLAGSSAPQVINKQ